MTVHRIEDKNMFGATMLACRLIREEGKVLSDAVEAAACCYNVLDINKLEGYVNEWL